MKHVKQLLILWVVLALALPLLVACGNTAGTASDAASSVEIETVSVPDEEPVHEDVPPEVKDLDGRVINVLCWDWSAGSASIKGYTGEIITNAEEDPGRVDVAKMAVIDAVETEYNVTISGQVTNRGSFSADVKNMVATGTYDYDLVFTGAGGSQDYAVNHHQSFQLLVGSELCKRRFSGRQTVLGLR